MKMKNLFDRCSRIDTANSFYIERIVFFQNMKRCIGKMKGEIFRIDTFSVRSDEAQINITCFFIANKFERFFIESFIILENPARYIPSMPGDRRPGQRSLDVNFFFTYGAISRKNRRMLDGFLGYDGRGCGLDLRAINGNWCWLRLLRQLLRLI